MLQCVSCNRTAINNSEYNFMRMNICVPQRKVPMEDELDRNEKVCREMMYIGDEDEFIRLHKKYIQ